MENSQPEPENAPPRKRRRAIRKLNSDPESMQLGDLLFYNPPKTIFQLENTPKSEIDDENNNPEDGLGDHLTSSSPAATPLSRRQSLRSRSNSIASQQSHGSHSESQDPVSEPENRQPTTTILNFDENGDPLDDKEQKDDENASKPTDDDDEQMLTFDEKGNIVIKNPAALEESQTRALEKPRANAVRSMTTYNSFRRNARSKGTWTTDETAIFYTALEIVGTDFSLMEAAFFKDRGRTRKQLKQKFKREEKINRAYIDSILFKSLTSPRDIPIDLGVAEVVTAHKSLVPPTITP